MAEQTNTLKPQKDKADRARQINDRLYDGVEEMAEWSRVGLKGRRYYHSRQWDDSDLIEGRRRLRITANVIRRDIDQMKGRLTDAEPQIEAQGRGAEDFQLGDTWKDLVRWSEEWTGDEYDSVEEVRDRIYDDFFQVGEGYEKVVWDPNEEGGLGMVVSKQVDGFHLIWDPDARSRQKRDARYVIEFEPVRIEELEEEFPKFKGKFTHNVPQFFTDTFQEAKHTKYEGLLTRQDASPVDAQRQEAERAYRIECWEKRVKYQNKYFLNGRPAFVEPEEGQREDLTDDHYGGLTPEEQEQYKSVRIKTRELWVSVVVNDYVVSEEKSLYDTSNGGHGEYPYAWYSNIWDPTQTHAHGEVEYLMGQQDVVNHTTSRWLETLFVMNSIFMLIDKGSLPKGEEGKLDLIGRKPLQKIFKYPGQAAPAFISAPPTSAQLFQAGIQFVKDLKDQQSGISDVNRQAPRYDMSGRAIQALQADADLFSVLHRKQIESGLRQATYLRIALMQQFMRGARLVRILPRLEEDEGYTLFLGEDEQRIKSHFNLQPEMEPPTQPGARPQPTGRYQTQDGYKGHILAINDQSIRKFDLRLVLSSGRERSKDERMQLVQALMQYLGPGAGVGVVKWAATLLEAPNRDELFSYLDQADAQAQVVGQLEQIKEQTGLGLQELMMLAQQYAQQRQGASPQ